MRKIKYNFYSEANKINSVELNKFKNGYLKLFDEKFKKKVDDISKKINSSLDHSQILVGEFNSLMNLAEKFSLNKDCSNWKALNELFKTNKGYEYDSKRKDILNFYFINEIGINSCHYCNIDFINLFNDEDNIKDHFAFDHVFSKAFFSFLSLSIFNLVPCCYPCNSKFKLKKEFINTVGLEKIIPSSTNYQFDKLANFRLKLNNNCEIKKIEDYSVHFGDLNYNKNIEDYIKMFKLEGRYEFHKKVSFDMIDKRKIYSDSQINEIAVLLKRDINSIKEDIFGKECFESKNEPFEKYKQDIARQLGLI